MDDAAVRDWLERNRTQVDDRPQLQVEIELPLYHKEEPREEKVERGVWIIDL